MIRLATSEESPARPWTVIALVAVVGINALYSVFVQATPLNPWNILFAVFVFSLLKALWDGERGVWWLFVILSTAAIVGGVLVALDEPPGVVAAAGGGVMLWLLVAPSTRAWFSVAPSEVRDATAD